MQNFDKTGKWLIFLYVIEYIALLVLLISSISLIQQGYKLIYETNDVTLLEILAHLYGFIFANIVLLFIPRAKSMILGNENSDDHE